MRLAKYSTRKIEKTISATVDSVEIDVDFTQFYDCFLILAFSIKSTTSFQILFYLLRITGRDNLVVINKKAVDMFNAHRASAGRKAVSQQAFYSSIKDLAEAGILRKLPPNRGTYFINPFAMWKADKTQRIEYLKQDHGIGQKFAINPINLLLNDPDHEYTLQVMQSDITDEDMQLMDGNPEQPQDNLMKEE